MRIRIDMIQRPRKKIISRRECSLIANDAENSRSLDNTVDSK